MSQIKGIKINGVLYETNISDIVTHVTSPNGTDFVVKVNDKGKIYGYKEGITDTDSSAGQDTSKNNDSPQTISSSEIELIDYNNNSRKYSISAQDGTLKISEKLGEQLTQDTADNTYKYYTNVDPRKNLLEFNEIYVNDRAESVNNPKHDTTLPVSHNFIELANLNNDKTIDLSNLYLQYADAHDAQNVKWHVLHLTGHINPGSTYSIRGAQIAPLNAPSTKLSINTFDQEWIEDGKPLAFNPNGCFYLTFDSKPYPETDAAKNPPANTDDNKNYSNYSNSPAILSSSANALLRPRAYVDLVGFGSNSLYADGKKPATVGNNLLLVKRNMFDQSSQANPKYGKDGMKRTDATNKGKYWENIDLSKHYFGNESEYTPKASFEHKNIYTTRTFFKEDRPYAVTVSFGIDATTTRTFNWVSPGNEDEFLFYRKVGDSKWIIKESYKVDDNQDPSLRTITKDNLSCHMPAYDRIYWETSGNTFVTTHKVIIKNNVTTDINGNPTPLESSIHYYTDKTLKTPSETKTEFTKGTEYEYCVGKAKYDRYGIAIAPAENASPIYKFQVRSQVTDTDWEYIQHTDEQGFTWIEYEIWRRVANIIRGQFNPQFTIDTGDMTQNGNHINEWLDYNNAAANLTQGLSYEGYLGGGKVSNESAGVEQMNVVGNNDLSPIPNYILGTGADAGNAIDAIQGKASAELFTYFYCYELDLNNFPGNIKETTNLQGEKSISVESIIPSCYSFNYNNCHFIGLCSEITNTAAVLLYGEDATKLNIKKDANIGYAYPKTNDLMINWLEKDLDKYYKFSANNWNINKATENVASTAIYPWTIVYMHEMPFTILTSDTAATTETSNDDFKTSHDNSRNGGSKLNNNASLQFRVSEILQNNHVRIVTGGHKHTHSQTWPLFENVYYKVNGVNKYSWELTSEQQKDASILDTRMFQSRKPIVFLPHTLSTSLKEAYTNLTGINATYKDRVDRNGIIYQANSDTDINWAPIYVMSQASGNKVISNKEKPTGQIPWFEWYYPAANKNASTDGDVAAGQTDPHFVEYVFKVDTNNSNNMNAGSIKINHWKVKYLNGTNPFSNFRGYQEFFNNYPEKNDPNATHAEMQGLDTVSMTNELGNEVKFTTNFNWDATKLRN